MEAMAWDYDVLNVEEFDALSVQVKDTVDPIDDASKPMEKFPAKLHARKVVKELGVLGGLIYLRGEAESTYEYSDMGPTFRQRRHFFYLTGLAFAGCAVTYHIRTSKLILWIPVIDPKRVLWYGRIPTFSECRALSDVDDVRDITDLPKYIAKRTNQHTPVYALDERPESLPPLPKGSPQEKAGWRTLTPGISRYMLQPAKISQRPNMSQPPKPLPTVLTPASASVGGSPRGMANALTRRDYGGGSEKGGNNVSSPLPPTENPWALPADSIPSNANLLLPSINAARVVKTPWEIRAIRRANAISSAAHAAVQATISTMTNEREAEAIFIRECVRRGAKYQAYPVIAGAGRNAATLHYEENEESLAGKELMVLDAGCEWMCYASDITRTLPVGGGGDWRKVSEESRQIYRIVDKMQKACIADIKKGKIYYELHILAHKIAAEELTKLGLIKAPEGTQTKEKISVEEIAEMALQSGVTTAFFPHGLGHHVGLETHDVTGRQRLLLTQDTASYSWETSGRCRAGIAWLPYGEPMPVPKQEPGVRKGKRDFMGPEDLVEMVKSVRDNKKGETGNTTRHETPKKIKEEWEVVSPSLLPEPAAKPQPQTTGTDKVKGIPVLNYGPRPDKSTQRQPDNTPASQKKLPVIPNNPRPEKVTKFLQSRSTAAEPAVTVNDTTMSSLEAETMRMNTRIAQSVGEPITTRAPPYAGKQSLLPGMVVTIEPGIYFCREYIEGYFLSNLKFASFIDVEVLERYYRVGGVRIEDDILVTEEGCENLTTAPRPTEI